MIETTYLVLAIPILLLILACLVIYNKLVFRRNLFKDAYSRIDTELKHRYDLIPSLLERLKTHQTNEQEILEVVNRARNLASAANTRAAGNPGDPGPMKGLIDAEGVLKAALIRLFAFVENHPEIKADETVFKLMEKIRSTEDKIGFARQGYNDAAMFYNMSREKFPNLLIANPFGFKEAFLLDLELTPAQREGPLLAY